MNSYMQKISCLSGFFIISLGLALFFSCTKESNSPTFETGTVTDIDNNVYKTVKIGNQWWMAENLKVRRYNNGDSIANIGNKLNADTWANTSNGTLYVGTLGVLYNGYVINDVRGIAPSGWHIPDDDEWKELEMYLGMSKDEADKVNWRGTTEGNMLKIQGAGPTVWTTPSDVYSVWGTNESGFSAFGCGCVLFNGTLGSPGANYTGFWWTSSELANEAWYRYLDYNKPNVFRFYGPKTYGFSVRCVKDNIITK